MEYNIPACPQQLANVARLFGRNVDGLPILVAAEQAVQAVHELKRDIGIPMRLRDLGIGEDELEGLAEATAKITRLLAMNPRPLDSESLEGIVRRAW